MSPDTYCPTCGAKTVEYRHSLTEPLVIALGRLLAAGGGPLNIKDLNLTRNQWDNFQKLKYFDLVSPLFRNGQRVRGQWVLTRLGERFLAGEVSVPSAVWTYRGKRTQYEGTRVMVDQVVPGYQQEWPERPADAA